MARHLAPARGHTLVELMVGLAMGLAVTAVALAAMAYHLRANQRMVAEARLTHDLHTVTDLIARHVRRGGALDVTPAGAHLQATDHTDAQHYRLRDGVIDMKIGDGHWQAMTDPQTMTVTRLRIEPRTHETVLHGHCGKPCAEADVQCPPRQLLRSADIEIAATPARGPSTDVRSTHVRSTQATVQQRHDALIGACPA